MYHPKKPCQFFLFGLLEIFLIYLPSCQPPKTNSTNAEERYTRNEFQDVLHVKGIPSNPEDLSVYSFADLGAWHSYSIPDAANKEFYGSIIGPFLMTQQNGVWQGQNLMKLELSEKGQGIILNEADADIHYLPGKLVQRYQVEDLEVSLELIFVSSRSSLIQTKITNKGKEVRELEIGVTGDTWMGMAKMMAKDQAVVTSFKDSPEQSILRNI